MVPEGWKKGDLGNLVDTVMGYAFKSKDFVESGVQLLRMGNLYQNSLDLRRNPVFLPTSYKLEFEKYVVKPGDLVMSMTGTMGKRDYGFTVEIPIEAPETLLNQRVIKLNPKKNTSSVFVVNLLQSEVILAKLYSFPGGTKQANLSAKQIQNLNILIPPFPEQKKIAQILSTWDKAITTTEKLLKNSQQQKKALMQQLLTGKSRIGFKRGEYSLKKIRYGYIPSEWKYESIKNICRPYSKKNNDGNDFPVLSCSKYDGFVDSLSYFKKKVYSDDTTGYRVIPYGYFGFPANHVEEGSIGLQKVYDYGLVSPIYVVFEPNNQKVNSEFLYAVLKTDRYRQIFSAATNASVDRRGSLRWKEFSEIRVPLPDLKEQEGIACILSAADTNVGVLEDKLNYLKQEKKALMQQLLTGKRRVKIE